MAKIYSQAVEIKPNSWITWREKRKRKEGTDAKTTLTAECTWMARERWLSGYDSVGDSGCSSSIKLVIPWPPVTLSVGQQR